jgi:pimeloyl-ACP methyl ester carboxylesterase
MHGVRHLGLVVVAVVIAAALVLGAAPPADARGAETDPQLDDPVLEWSACGSAECATLAVPLDDTVADSPSIELALLRVPARDPDRRIGSLVVNPGGPGAPGRDFAANIAAALPEEIQDRFDIVGFDPRGTGRTIPVACDDELDPLYATDWAPDTDGERAALEDANRAFVESCVRLAGERLGYVSSDRTVRDMDRIRAALGDEQLTYLGFSYGSYLGALYAQEFPGRVRALALDGAVDPALDAAELQVQQADGFERSLELFLADCARTDDCAFAAGKDPGAAYDDLRAQVDASPIEAAEGRVLNQTLFDIGVTELLYDGAASWGTLDEALAAAVDGDGRDLVSYADAYTGRDGDGTYDNLQAAFIAIGCADGPPVGDAAGLRVIEDAAEEAAPRVGASIVNNSMACAFWPIAARAPTEVRAPDADPILVLGTRNDPATPVAWARSLADQLESAVLVTVGGARHTAFAAGNACVDRIVVRYLVQGATPRDGRRC